MLITKFSIKNYKSIVDSGDCYPDEILTIFAGKNEAGKTSILDALEDFNTTVSIKDKSCPIGLGDKKPAIAITFDVDSEVIEDCLDTIGHDSKCKITEKTKVTLTKIYPKTYRIESDFLQDSGIKSGCNFYKEITTLISKTLDKKFKAFAAQKQVPVPAIALKSLTDDLAAITNFITAITPHFAELEEAARENAKDGLEAIKGALQEYRDEVVLTNKFKEELLKWVPNFILFRTFTDVFPSSIPIAELAANEWIKDLQKITDLNVDTILGDNDRGKKQHKTEVNSVLNDDFKQFWTQDLSWLEIDWDSQKLNFWIKEDDNYYEPSERSQGRQWHLAFYIKVTARSKEDVQNIILIDEPGLYLHASAQRDIIGKLEEAGKTGQVFITTHSPYLINPDKLERLRLVVKKGLKGVDKKDGTKIIDKIHKVSDKETLTPIYTAIGLELDAGITNIGCKDNVVVEGAADYFYLNAFKLLLQKKEYKDINFINGGGAGNMTFVGSILQGWGCNVVYLYDSDQGYADALKNIQQKWHNVESSQIAKLPVDGAIEDIFTLEELTSFAGTTIKGAAKPSKAVKDKVVTAKKFHARVRAKDIDLSQETKQKITALFSEIAKKLVVT